MKIIFFKMFWYFDGENKFSRRNSEASGKSVTSAAVFRYSESYNKNYNFSTALMTRSLWKKKLTFLHFLAKSFQKVSSQIAC